MGSLFNHNKCKIFIVILVVAVVVIVAFFVGHAILSSESSSKSTNGNIPLFIAGHMIQLTDLGPKPLYEEYPNSIWISDEPTIYMTVSDSPYSENGSYLIVEGERIPVNVFITEKEDRAIISQPSSDGKVENVLLEGDHVRINDKEISFEVTYDELFSGKYTSITLKRAE